MHHSGTRRAKLVAAWCWQSAGLRAVLALACLMMVAACAFPGSVKPTVKVGLSAPFEGLYRDVGYEVLYAVRLAVHERNAIGGIGERLLVELVALNDLNEAKEAAEQARKMAADPDMLGVLGGFSEETARLTWDYDQLGLAYMVPDMDLAGGSPQIVVDASFAERYAEQSGGAEPGVAAVWAYSAANRLMDAMDVATRTDGHPTRTRVREVLEETDG